MSETMKEQYVAYVSSYTFDQEDKVGIRIYDVDMENGRFTEKDSIKVTNSSYVTISHCRKYLYSITDFGVESYKIGKGGSLTFINFASINGMRGSYLSTDYTDRWLFVAGYHDGKITVLRIREDGSIGEITDEIYHKGLGSMAERSFRPHVQCVKMSRDNKFLFAADLGMDHIKVYKFDSERGKIKQIDILHCEQYSAPRHLKFSKDGSILYAVHELKNYIVVYSYECKGDFPICEKLQTISTLNNYHSTSAAASALNLSEDFGYLISTNSGDNSAVVYRIDPETGLLDKLFCLPTSGDYPKDATLFPDNRHLVALNHESNTMTFFTTDLEKKTMVMHGPALKVAQPNCVIFHKLTDDQV